MKRNFTAMLNNSPNINKINNYLSPQIIEEGGGKQRHMTLKIQYLAWYRYTNVAGLNRLMGSQPSPS
jgi:hypothetical protein